jgi:hypothetical protein
MKATRGAITAIAVVLAFASAWHARASNVPMPHQRLE